VSALSRHSVCGCTKCFVGCTLTRLHARRLDTYVGPLWGEPHLAALARSRDLLARVRVLRDSAGGGGGGAPCYACGELTGSPHPSTMRGELVGGTLMRPPHPASVRGKRLASYERQTHASSWPRADKECGGAFALWRRHAYTSSLPGIGRSLCAILEARSWTPWTCVVRFALRSCAACAGSAPQRPLSSCSLLHTIGVLRTLLAQCSRDQCRPPRRPRQAYICRTRFCAPLAAR